MQALHEDVMTCDVSLLPVAAPLGRLSHMVAGSLLGLC